MVCLFVTLRVRIVRNVDYIVTSKKVVQNYFKFRVNRGFTNFFKPFSNSFYQAA